MTRVVILFVVLAAVGFVAPLSAQTIGACDSPYAAFGSDTVPSVTSEILIEHDEQVVDIEVSLSVSHTFIADVEVSLVSPAGTTATLFAAIGDGADDLSLIISESGVSFAAELYTCGCRMRPPTAGALDAYIGEGTQGAWSLTVLDNFLLEDPGTLNFWCLFLYHLRTPLEEVCSSPSAEVSYEGGTASDALSIEGDWLAFDVEISVDLPHTAADELVLVATSPQGTQMVLFDGSGASASGIDAVFSAYGTGRPSDCNCLKLSADPVALGLLLEHARGEWSLEVLDLYAGEDGTLDEWCVRVFGEPLVHRAWFSSPGFYFGDAASPAAVTDAVTVTSDDEEVVDQLAVYVEAYHFAGLQDLAVTLESPAGTEVTLHDRQAGGPGLYIRYAMAGDPHGTVPLTAFYYSGVNTQPSGPGTLEDFVGEGIDGDWRLTLSDENSDDSIGGFLSGWALEFARAADRTFHSLPGTYFADSSGAPLLEAAIDVDETREIEDLDVTIDVTHPWVGELLVQVASPAGTRVTLHDYYTFDDRDGMRIVWSDLGYDYSVTAPFLVDFATFLEPSGPGTLGDFAGESPDGEWLLVLSDEFPNGDSGALSYWGLRLFVEDAVLFRRGDADGNGTTSGLQDALFILNYAFTGGATPPCLDAADVDGNGSFSGISDGLALLGWAFIGGDVPPAPGPTTCGPDGDDTDALGCETPPDCD